MTLPQTIGANIKRLRVAQGLTQEEFSGEIGVSRPSLSQYESGERCFPTPALVVAARFFKVSIDDLVK